MKLLKRFSLFEILLVISILGIHFYAAMADGYLFPNTWFIRDDAYYYFKVAQNISQGLGSTFDGINLTNGYHPLWLLICIPIFALARFDLILPLRVLLVLIAILDAATAVLIYRIISRSLSKSVGILAACFWAFNGYLHYAFYRPGLETPLAAFAVVLFTERLGDFELKWRANKATLKQIGWLAALSVFVMFSRLDLVFLAIIAGIYIVFRGHPIRFLLPFDIVLIFLSMTSSVALRAGFPGYNAYAEAAVFATVIALAIKITVFYFTGLYNHPKRQTARGLIRRVVIASALGAVIFSAVIMLFMLIGIIEEFPRIALLYDWGVSFGLILLLRFTARWFGSKAINPDPPALEPLIELRLNWKQWLMEGWLYYRIVGGTLALYMLFNKIFFGAFMPVSGQIKRWWGTLLHTVYDYPATEWTAFFGIGYKTPYDAWAPISHAMGVIAVKIKPLYPGSDTEDKRYYIVMIVLLLLVSLVLFFNSRRALRAFSGMALVPLISSGGIHTLSYTATAYGGAKEWYWISQILIAIFVLSIAIHFLLRPFQKFKPLRLLLEVAAVAAGIYYSYDLNSFIIKNMPHNVSPADRPYMEVVTYLEKNTHPGAVIGMTGGGNVAYFIEDRTIVNMDGLINSYDYFHALQRREAPEYLYQHGMRVVFANIRLLSFPPYDGQFTPYLATFNMSGNKNLMWLLPEPKKSQ